MGQMDARQMRAQGHRMDRFDLQRTLAALERGDVEIADLIGPDAGFVVPDDLSGLED